MEKTWKKWELWEYDYLKNNYTKITVEDMAKYLVRTKKAVIAQLHRLRLVEHIPYTNKEEAYIRDNYGKIPTILIASKLKRTTKAIVSKACELGVAKGVRILSNKRTEKSLAIDKYIIENYSNKKAKEISRFLGISVENVKIRAFKLGLRKYNV